MALGDLITDLSTIGTFNSGDAGPQTSIAVSNSGNFVARAYTMSGDTCISIYDLANDVQIFDGILDNITGISSVDIVGSAGNEVLLIGEQSGSLFEITIQDIIDGVTQTTLHTLNNSNGIVVGVSNNGLDYTNTDCQVALTFQVGNDYIVQIFDSADYNTVIGQFDHSGTDITVAKTKMIYDETSGETNIYAAVLNQSTGDVYVEGYNSVSGNLTDTTVSASDITTLSALMGAVDLELSVDSVSGNILATLLVVGMDGSSNTVARVAVYDLTTNAFVEEAPSLAYMMSINMGLLQSDSGEDVALYPTSQTEVTAYSDVESVLITTTEMASIATSRNSEVVIIEEISSPQTASHQATALRAFEGYNYSPPSTISFPTEENIYFFNLADELINELDVGQLSPIKDTDIYAVQIATNITTDTFESITLGTTENSVNCLLSNTEDPFESLEQLTIPFTNEDVVTVYLKLATDEVQTVGDASLELLVVGNVATT